MSEALTTAVVGIVAPLAGYWLGWRQCAALHRELREARRLATDRRSVRRFADHSDRPSPGLPLR